MALHATTTTKHQQTIVVEFLPYEQAPKLLLGKTFRILECARTSAFGYHGVQPLINQFLFPDMTVIRHNYLAYINSPALLQEGLFATNMPFEVRSQITEVKKSSYTMTHWVKRVDTIENGTPSRLIAIAKTVFVRIDLNSGRSTPVSEGLHKLITEAKLEEPLPVTDPDSIKGPLQSNLQCRFEYEVLTGISMIDRFGHVNQAKVVDMVDDAFYSAAKEAAHPFKRIAEAYESGEIGGISLDYREQVYDNQVLVVSLVALEDEAKQVVACGVKIYPKNRPDHLTHVGTVFLHPRRFFSLPSSKL
eukprot:TRINITY_DN6757_c0_g1_i1.p1 TRINITY_DN6757_c0_g1~~TRINITY_DN6757_c0_g1_i1.p1  ORF type:complete len:313 (+),score=59.53 TRINITY_DN6757_c0_g1_i1:29-940(+)